jgi:hypothetical protein
MDRYTNDEGNTVLTAEFHLKRGRCCRSSCLHCPYGHTVSTIGFEFLDFTEDKKELVEQILIENEFNKPQSLADQMLSANLGTKRKELKLSSYDPNDIKVLTLKDIVCGFVIIENDEVKRSFLAKRFQFQRIELSTIKL